MTLLTASPAAPTYTDAAKVRGVPAPMFACLNLPGGMTNGFVSVTLGFVLRNRGFSVAAIAELLALYILPTSWKFLTAPVLDLSLSPKRWYIISIGVLTSIVTVLAFVPMQPSSLPVLSALIFSASVAVVGAGNSLTPVIALTIPARKRGAVAGWTQAANLGGAGLGGGAGLWIASHAGGLRAAALALAGACLLSALPILLVHTPRVQGHQIRSRVVELWRALWRLVRTRTGALAVIAVSLPASLGAATSLLPAVAGDWNASANVVALTTGLLGGLASVPGCLAGGYLCDRFSPRTVYVWASFACALGELAMGLAPHTAMAFAAFVLINAALLGVSWGAVQAVVLECLGPIGAATVGSVLFSLLNLPVVAVTVFVGYVQTRRGSTAMLVAEAALAFVSVAILALLGWWWRPSSVGEARHDSSRTSMVRQSRTP